MTASPVGSVGFVGLGNIGAAMAQRLLDRPAPLLVHDVRAEATAPFVEKGARAVPLDELARECWVISVVVLTDGQVRDVVAQLLEHAAEGTIVAIHSTIEPNTAAELAEEAAVRGVHVLDAPVSGGAVGAAEGRLAVMVGGDRAAYDLAAPVFRAWAEVVVHLGPAGAGTRCKLARNLLTFAGFAAAAEASRLAEAAGIDLRKLAAVVRHSDAITGGPGATMIRATTAPLDPADGLRPVFEHTRALGEKDLAQALALGEQLGVDLPFAALALSSLADGLGVPHEERT
jgi:3-hydroxyisobutyrate dehydrogenase-like beta-hydroxyacid dehydrogenase